MLRVRRDRVLRLGLVRATVVAAALAVTATAASDIARAAPQISVETEYYEVRGSTSHELLRYMMRRGPRGHAGRALGTTSARITQNSEFDGKARCGLRNYRLGLDLVIRLPRLAEGQQLPRAVRKKWNHLAAYVRNHENRHKVIYEQCARRIDRRVRALNRTMSCAAFAARMREIFNEENARCDRRHVEFDRAEESPIRRLPLIADAARNSPRAASNANRAETRRSSSSRSSTSAMSLK